MDDFHNLPSDQADTQTLAAAFIDEWRVDNRRGVVIRNAMAVLSGRRFNIYELHLSWPDAITDEKKDVKKILDSFSARDFKDLSAFERHLLWRGVRIYMGLSEGEFPYPENFQLMDYQGVHAPADVTLPTYRPSSAMPSFETVSYYGVRLFALGLFFVIGYFYHATFSGHRDFPVPQPTLSQAFPLPPSEPSLVNPYATAQEPSMALPPNMSQDDTAKELNKESGQAMLPTSK